MRSLGLITLALLSPLLVGCGTDYSAEVRALAEDHCETTEGVSEYDNPDGWDRCVEDNLEPAQKLQDCLDEASDPNLKTYLSCSTEAGW